MLESLATLGRCAAQFGRKVSFLIHVVSETSLPTGVQRLFARSIGALRVVGGIGAHWLALTNALLAIILVGAVAAALLAAAGFDDIAAAIHHLYLWICPQRPEHSYFLLGHQLALEHREIAMFAAQIGGGLLYAAVRHRPEIRLRSWVVLVVSVPMALDIATEMLGVRESDWFTRSWTGALFNLGFALWFYPRIEHPVPRLATRQMGGTAEHADYAPKP